MRVMVVDDSTAVRQRLAAGFRKASGVEAVAEVSSGEAAMAQLDGFRPDLVMLDLMLPGMSGIEVLAALKERRPSVKVAVLTNYPNLAFRKRCLELGATHFFGKTTELGRILELVIEKGPAEAASDPEAREDA
ncbi:MAG: response regulator transcription factor [Longimicrobiales bacterium]